MQDISVAYYREKDWNRFLEMAEDRENLNDTWEEWFETYQSTLKKMRTVGFKPHEIVIDLDALYLYCQSVGLPNTGKTRAGYVARLAEQAHAKKVD